VFTSRSSWLCAALLLLAACEEPLAPPHPGDKPYHAPVAPPAVAHDATLIENAVAIDAGTATGPVPAVVLDAAAAGPPPTFYSVIDALDDAKASPLKYVGIGAWPGNYSIKACIYRNDRVFLVDVYCTYREQPALSVVVISPTKGYVELYAEGDKAISQLTRKEYMTFNADVYPPLADLPAPPLDATFEQVTDWKEKSYNTRLKLPAFGACSTEIAECADPTWVATSKELIANPPDEWTWVIDQIRNRAQHDGKYVKKGTKK
jgi:hypothetical protein